jgi:hypothetical protein
MLSSAKYKEFFYKTVNYSLNNKKIEIKPYGDTVLDRIYKFIAKSFLYLFDRKLYDSIKIYLKWKARLDKINAKADEYIANTTVQQRIDRAVEIGLITKKDSENLKDTDDFSQPVEGDISREGYLNENNVQKVKRVYKKRKSNTLDKKDE